MFLDSDLQNRLNAYIEMARPYTVPYAGLVGITGYVISGGGIQDFSRLIEVAFAMMLCWISGIFLNDYFHRDLDKIDKPSRPIPSGRIKASEVLNISVLMIFGAIILSLHLSLSCFFIGTTIIILATLYNKMLKSKGILGNVCMGIAGSLVLIYGAMASYGISTTIILIALVFLLHDTSSNIVGTFRDYETDKKGGYITLPVIAGLKMAYVIAGTVTLSWTILGMYLWLNGYVGKESFPLLSLSLIIMFYTYFILGKNITNLTPEIAFSAHKNYLIERIILGTAFMAGFIQATYVYVLCLMVLIFTYLTQKIMRSKHEGFSN